MTAIRHGDERADHDSDAVDGEDAPERLVSGGAVVTPPVTHGGPRQLGDDALSGRNSEMERNANFLSFFA